MLNPRVKSPPGLARAEEDDFASAVLDGLSGAVKTLPCRFFYDARGSELFEEITRLPEYYPTRAEREILTSRAGEIVAATKMGELVELGSGTATKTRVLLDAATEAGMLRRYVPFDVAESVVRGSLTYTVDGVQVVKTIERLSLTPIDVLGTYLGGMLIKNSAQCNGGANTSPVWPSTVERAVASGIARFDEDGALRVVKDSK